MMPNLTIYEGPLNSPSGLSFQPGADNGDMLRVAQFEYYLREQGVKVERANMTTSPRAFLADPQILEYISDDEDSLPLVYVNGDLKLKGRYPEDAELAEWFSLPALAQGAPLLSAEQMEFLRQEALIWGDCAPTDCSTCAGC